jgi:hypothetical protein
MDYARYMKFFSEFLANIKELHPAAGSKELIMQGDFSFARSFIPGNQTIVDKTIEETFKSKGGAGGSGAGLVGLLRNYNAYQVWVQNIHEHSQYVDTFSYVCIMQSSLKV